ncbi:Gfo/Idh/MocA family oxidoreductase [Nocardia takedensis]|uniref:Gfo/Idh/MocA family oxidoreductase n=1 Tax=Nocardia takedensis TaxID=259390 RepID=UPI0002E769AD|nr:Gfo/Idh/MocA family oxidoreductase [Nocardia takedensis]
MTPPTAIVVGGTFGGVYVDALAGPGSPVRLIGVAGTGAGPARDLAARLGLPFHTDLDALPPVDIGVVVVRSAIVGGVGSGICERLLDRGVHVLQEQPVHAEEMLRLAAIAHRHRVRYGVNDFYGSVAPVRHFVTAARRLAARTPIRYVQARTAVHVAFPLFTVLSEIVPRLHPARVVGSLGPAAPFTEVRLTLDEITVDVRIDNTLCARDPDNHLRLLHEITVGTDAGELALAHTHGPTHWRPRDPRALPDSAVVRQVGPGHQPTAGEIVRDLWPAAVRHAVAEFAEAIRERRNPLTHRFVRAARLWSEVTAAAGPPTVYPPPPPLVITAEELSPPCPSASIR